MNYELGGTCTGNRCLILLDTWLLILRVISEPAPISLDCCLLFCWGCPRMLCCMPFCLFTRQTLTNFTLLPHGVRTTQNKSIETSHNFAGAFASYSQDPVLQQSQSKVCSGIFSKIKRRFSPSIFYYHSHNKQRTVNRTMTTPSKPSDMTFPPSQSCRSPNSQPRGHLKQQQ